jgi:hypothetical protein
MTKQEKTAVLEDNKEIIKSFSLQMPAEIYSFLFSKISDKVNQGYFGYNFKSAFLDGLRLLKEKNPAIGYDEVTFKRFFRGLDEEKKTNGVLKKTSILLTQKDINWINNYINNKIKMNLSYSKVNFMEDLVREIKLNKED